MLAVVGLMVKLAAVGTRLDPTVINDEHIYHFRARSLAELGRWFVMETGDLQGQLYAPAYSVLLAPAWLVTDDPDTAYRLGLILNAFVLASIVVPAARLARRLGGPELLSAALVSLWVVPQAYVMNAMSEALFVPLYLWTGLAWERMAERPTPPRQVLAGVAVAALLLTRNAALAMLPAILVLVLLERREGRLRPARPRSWRNRTPLLLTALVPWIAWRVWLTTQGPLYHLDQQPVRDYLLLGVLGAFVSWSQVLLLAGLVLGQLTYLFLATLGLATTAWRGAVEAPPRSRVLPGGAAFFLLTGLGLSGASIAHMVMQHILKSATGEPLLPRDYMYGRYVDMLVPVLLVYGVAGLHRLAAAGAVSVGRTWAVGLAGFLVSAWTIPEVVYSVVMNIGVGWYDWLREDPGGWSRGAAVGAAGLLWATVVLLWRRWPAAAAAVLLAVQGHGLLVQARLLAGVEASQNDLYAPVRTVEHQGGVLYVDPPSGLYYPAKFRLHTRALPVNSSSLRNLDGAAFLATADDLVLPMRTRLRGAALRAEGLRRGRFLAASVELRLAVPSDTRTVLLRLELPRGQNAPPVPLEIHAPGTETRVELGPGRHDIPLAIVPPADADAHIRLAWDRAAFRRAHAAGTVPVLREVELRPAAR